MNNITKANIEELKKAREKLDDAILGYCDGKVATELDEAFAIIDKIIKEKEELWNYMYLKKLTVLTIKL